jgi:hypothetical protein
VVLAASELDAIHPQGRQPTVWAPKQVVDGLVGAVARVRDAGQQCVQKLIGFWCVALDIDNIPQQQAEVEGGPPEKEMAMLVNRVPAVPPRPDRNFGFGINRDHLPPKNQRVVIEMFYECHPWHQGRMIGTISSSALPRNPSG